MLLRCLLRGTSVSAIVRQITTNVSPKKRKEISPLPPGNADPQVGGNHLHNRNVAGIAPNVRQYRFAPLSGGNSGAVFGIELGG
jgi:hypothetical protein